MPYFLKSRYHSKASIGRLCSSMPFAEQVNIVDALRAAADFAVALRRDQVGAQHRLRPFRVGLHIERLGLRRVMRDKERAVVLGGEHRLFVAAEVVAPLHRQAVLIEDLDSLVVSNVRERGKHILQLLRIALQHLKLGPALF